MFESFTSICIIIVIAMKLYAVNHKDHFLSILLTIEVVSISFTMFDSINLIFLFYFIVIIYNIVISYCFIIIEVFIYVYLVINR